MKLSALSIPFCLNRTLLLHSQQRNFSSAENLGGHRKEKQIKTFMELGFVSPDEENKGN